MQPLFKIAHPPTLAAATIRDISKKMESHQLEITQFLFLREKKEAYFK